MQTKGHFSLIMMIVIGAMSAITSMAGHKIDLDAKDDMEELALIMAAAAEQEFTAKAMACKHLHIIVYCML